MKILLVEDDVITASFISKGLKQDGHSVNHVADGEEGLYYAQNETYDLIIADIMLPKLDGLSMIEQLRRKKIKVPVIVLSARNSVDDKVKGLRAGGDDYLVKPFSFSELLARVHALNRRAAINPEADSVIIVHDLRLDLIRRKVFRAEKEITLSSGEFVLLEYLVRNAGRVVSKTMIIENVWEYNFDTDTNIIEARMCRLREKIDKPFKKKLIHTLRGFGYVIKEDA